MSRASVIPIFAAMLALAFTATTASAGRIDYDLAGAGTRISYSDLVNAIPTAWDVHVNRSPLSDPTVLRYQSAFPTGMDQAENGSAGMLGQIVRIGHPNGASRHVWGVYDRLSAIAAPQLLYYHDGALPRAASTPLERAIGHRPWLGTPSGVRGGSPAATSGSPSAPTARLIEEAVPIPEPSSMVLTVIAATALLASRR